MTELFTAILRDKQGKFIKGNQSRLGAILSKESRKKMSLAKIGVIPSNKGHKLSNELKHKLSEAHKKTFLTKNIWNKGKHNVYNKDRINKMSFFAKSRIREQAPNWKGGKPNCKVCGKSLSNYNRIYCLKCHLGTKRMTTMEIKVQEVITKHNLPYKFVGNGAFFIEKKNPDFININGEKKAVEVYWNKHKEQFARGGLEGWKKDRIDIFNKYGWEIIFLDEQSINEKKILNLLGKVGY